jgi:phage gp29-like protein
MRAYWENSMRNLQMNQQSAMILPNAYDPETKQPLFKLDLLSLDGKKAMDTAKVKEYYKNLIFTTLFSDVLILGQGNTGSFALGQVKNSLTGSYAEALLDGIVEILNMDLMRQTYELNGWDTSRMCRFDYENLESDDLETLSKAIQRMGAVAFLPKTLDVVNKVLESIGVDALPEGTDLDKILPDKTTKSGQGMQEGMNSGTGSADGGSGNASDMNADNIA